MKKVKVSVELTEEEFYLLRNALQLKLSYIQDYTPDEDTEALMQTFESMLEKIGMEEYV